MNRGAPNELAHFFDRPNVQNSGPNVYGTQNIHTLGEKSPNTEKIERRQVNCLDDSDEIDGFSIWLTNFPRS